MKRINSLVLIILLICICVLCGCVKETNYEALNEVNALEEKKREIYDESIQLAENGEFENAINKLQEFDRPYLDSEDLIETFSNIPSSKFIGAWYCSRENSCNDMDITLTIKAVYRMEKICLYFERNMKSQNGAGSSQITGIVDILSSSSVFVSGLNGAEWTISGNKLKEVFSGDENKANIYEEIK